MAQVMMKERPILFSDAMIRAILSGRKTQTRRVVKPAPPSVEAVHAKSGSEFSIASSKWTGHPEEFTICGPVGVACEIAGLRNAHTWSCPYGVPGDRLWVREAWKTEALSHQTPSNGAEKATYYLGYKADLGGRPAGRVVRFPSPVSNAWQKNRDGWRPSIHMPRWASRITLEVTDIRVERVKDISEEDAKAEGCTLEQGRIDAAANHDTDPVFVKDVFRRLWESLHGAGEKSWNENPWVWVVGFKVLEEGKE